MEDGAALFRNKKFMLDEIVERNAEKFAIFQKYGNFWSILLDNFIKHKPLISEDKQKFCNLKDNNTAYLEAVYYISYLPAYEMKLEITTSINLSHYFFFKICTIFVNISMLLCCVVLKWNIV